MHMHSTDQAGCMDRVVTRLQQRFKETSVQWVLLLSDDPNPLHSGEEQRNLLSSNFYLLDHSPRLSRDHF